MNLNALFHLKLAELEGDIAEQRELASNRLVELEKLNVEYQNSLKQVEKYKADVLILN
jgi:hypothetical protein